MSLPRRETDAYGTESAPSIAGWHDEFAVIRWLTWLLFVLEMAPAREKEVKPLLAPARRMEDYGITVRELQPVSTQRCFLFLAQFGKVIFAKFIDIHLLRPLRSGSEAHGRRLLVLCRCSLLDGRLFA